MIKEDSGSSKKRMTAQEREELLIENFVSLQHAMTNLSIKFNTLSENISRLLQVFEEAAKRFVVERSKDQGAENSKEMIKKIDSLIEQNKTIAQGLVMMEEKLRSKVEQENFKLKPRPLPNI